MIEKYNKLIKEIVQTFANRYLTEINEETTIADKYDYDIMDYVWILQGPVECNDIYLSLDDILIAEMYNIPIAVIIDWYDYTYDDYINWKDKQINLYNYWRNEKKTL